MLLADDLSVGHYKVLTVGGLTNHFRVSDVQGNRLSPGKTMLGDVQVALERLSQTVSHEFFPLWIGKTIKVDYKADREVYPVSLVKTRIIFTCYWLRWVVVVRDVRTVPFLLLKS